MILENSQMPNRNICECPDCGRLVNQNVNQCCPECRASLSEAGSPKIA